MHIQAFVAVFQLKASTAENRSFIFVSHPPGRVTLFAKDLWLSNSCCYATVTVSRDPRIEVSLIVPSPQRCLAR